MRPSLQFFYTHWEWSSILWDRKQNSDLCCLLSPFFPSLTPIEYIGKFVTNISQELLHIGFCNLVQVLWIICCFMWKRTRFLLLTLPLISSLFFLSNFQIKNLISLFSGTERHTKLKLGPHMDSRLMYHMYLNHAGVYLFLYFFFFSLKFQNIKFLSHFSVSPTKLKLDTHMDKGLIYCVH